MKKNIIIFALIGMFLLNFVNPQPPLQTSENGLEIQTSYAEKYPLGKDMNIYAHVRDRETGNLIETDELNCSFHVYSHLKGGEPILIIEEMTPYGVGFEYNINGSYFNEKGEYSILIFCNSVTKGGFFQYTFNIEHFPEGILSLNLNETSHLVGLIIIFFFIIAFMEDKT